MRSSFCARELMGSEYPHCVKSRLYIDLPRWIQVSTCPRPCSRSRLLEGDVHVRRLEGFRCGDCAFSEAVKAVISSTRVCDVKRSLEMVMQCQQFGCSIAA